MKKNILSNGFCILSLKKKTDNLVRLAITDFSSSSRFLFDTSKEKFINPVIDLKLNSNDLCVIRDYINEAKSPSTSVKLP